MSEGGTAGASPRLLAFALLIAGSPSIAQENLADLAPFREGCQALADERFATAVGSFRECWDLLRDGESGGPEGNFVAARLVEAYVRDGATGEAVAWVLANPGFQPAPSTSYWIASAFQAEERFAEAADYFQIHLAATADPPSPVVINRAVCLARSGQATAGFDLVSALTPSTPGEALRLAQIAAAAQRSSEALTFLESIDPDDPSAAPLRHSAAHLRASLLIRTGDRAGAMRVLYGVVESSADADEARRAFLLLESLLDGAKPAGLSERLAAWENDPSFPGREAASLFRHVLLDEAPARDESLRAFASTTNDPALKQEAALRLTDPETMASPAGEGLPGDLQERLDFKEASSAYNAGRFEEAAERFTSLAARDSGEAAARDLFNAAVSSLRNDDATAFSSLEEALEKHDPRSRLVADLSFLGGLYLAAEGDPGAFERLNLFVQKHPDHPVNVDARLALAEIHLNQAPARPSDAREIFEELRTRPLTLAQNERLDYTSVWVELIDGKSSELLRRAEEFVADWPSSEHLGEILMILAAEHYSRKNFAAAANAFHRVATEFPESTHAATARFFEAKASPANDETVAKWRRIVEAKAPLADEAAHELGLLFLSLDRFGEARAALEGLVERLAPEAPLRYAALADLAYTHYLEALADGRDTAKLEEAAARFAALSNLAEAPALWRYNAAVRRGKCLEALGKAPVALEIYRSIVEETRSTASSPLPPEETEWVFRAGFAAIEILKAEKNWGAAIEIADALSEKSGPRAIEATRLAERLRLKHWVWD